MAFRVFLLLDIGGESAVLLISLAVFGFIRTFYNTRKFHVLIYNR